MLPFSGVNLIALESRFVRMVCIWPLSTATGIDSVSESTFSCNPLAEDSDCKPPARYLTNNTKSTGSGFRAPERSTPKQARST